MKLYRKRFEPKECILLEKDDIIYKDNSYICTKWETLKPRNDFDNGASIYDIDHGVKVSKFCKGSEIIYYYIDIIGMEFSEEDDTYVCTDYILDIILETDLKAYKVLDEDEFDELTEQGVLSTQEIAESYAKLGFMKDCIEQNNFNFYLELFKNVGL